MHDRNEEESNNFTLLRLLLALAVVLGHFKSLSGMNDTVFPFNLADAAVDAFFVVSGFLIAGSFDRSRGVLEFYTRRVFRLLPMYVFILLVQTALILMLLPGGMLSAPERTLRYLVVNLSFANFLQYDIAGVLDRLRVPGINPSLWTLKIEMGFYLVVPLICLAVRRWGWGVLALIFAASALYHGGMMHLGAVRYAKQLPGQLQFFTVGMALHLYGHRLIVGRGLAVAVCVGFLVIWTLFQPLPAGVSPIVTGAFVFCFALCLPVMRVKRDLSYSVYLMHAPLIQTAILLGLFHDTPAILLAVVATVLVLSVGTERWIERPSNRFGKGLSRRLRRSGPIAATPGGVIAQH